MANRELEVPFNDLYKQYLSIKEEIDEAIAAVIRKSAFIRGPYVEQFEAQFAAAVGSQHCVTCANGTDALYIALVSLGLKVGQEVIVPAMTWISTSEAVTQAGGRVVFCDVDPTTMTIDVNRIADKITDRTVGIIPVHLYGQPAEMGGVMAIAEKRSLWVIEDCAQAHLATIDGRMVGTFGIAGTFSFYPGKNLGAMGDAGAIVTKDAGLAARMAMFARHGGLVKGHHQIEGINSRMDGLQAAILSAKLPHLALWTNRRRTIATRYSAQLREVESVILPDVAKGRQHVWHLYVVRHTKRDKLAAFLRSRGIQTVVNYPRALPFLPCYEYLQQSASDHPVAWEMQSRVLSLPLFPEMRDSQVDAVVRAVAEFI